MIYDLHLIAYQYQQQGVFSSEKQISVNFMLHGSITTQDNRFSAPSIQLRFSSNALVSIFFSCYDIRQKDRIKIKGRAAETPSHQRRPACLIRLHKVGANVFWVFFSSWEINSVSHSCLHFYCHFPFYSMSVACGCTLPIAHIFISVS